MSKLMHICECWYASANIGRIYGLHNVFYSGYSGNRLKLMLGCWCSEPETWLNFTQLKYSFKSMIFATNSGNSYVTVQPTPCCTSATVDVPLSSSSLGLRKEPFYEKLSAADVRCQPMTLP